MYNEKVMEAFKNPKNVGEVENYDGLGKVGNAACGDIMQITLKIDNDVITDAKFKTFGCAAAIATSSTATEMVKGMTVDEAIAHLDKYLDDAYVAHLPSVRIVHGKGTGALRNAVQAHLKNQRYVKSYRMGEPSEGGAGVTIAAFDV